MLKSVHSWHTIYKYTYQKCESCEFNVNPQLCISFHSFLSYSNHTSFHAFVMEKSCSLDTITVSDVLVFGTKELGVLGQYTLKKKTCNEFCDRCLKMYRISMPVG